MKKVIGFLSIVVIAIALFLSSSILNNKSNTDLASLIAMNVATAQIEVDPDADECSKEINETCIVYFANGGVFISTRCEPDTWWTFSDCL